MIFRFFAVRQLDQFFRLRRARGKRLLDENVLAVFKRGFRKLVVRPNGRNHGNASMSARFNNLQCDWW